MLVEVNSAECELADGLVDAVACALFGSHHIALHGVCGVLLGEV